MINDKKPPNNHDNICVNSNPEQLISILDALPDMICRFLPDTTLTYVNKAYCQAFNMTPEELIGKKFLDLIPEDQHHIVKNNIAKINPQARIRTYIHKSITKDGRTVWHEWTDEYIEVIKGKKYELQSIGRDITNQKIIENELYGSKTLIKYFSEYHKVFSWETDKNGVYTHISEHSEKIIGYKPDEIVGKLHYFDLHPQQDIESFKEKVFQLNQSKLIFFNLENPIICKNGSIIWVTTYGVPSHDLDGNYKGYQGFDVDISEMKLLQSQKEENNKIEHQLEQSQKLYTIGELTSGITHDFNNMLMIILNYCELLLEKLTPTDNSYEPIRDIRNTAGRAASLTRELLNFAGTQKENPKIIDLNQELEKFSSILRRIIGYNIIINWQQNNSVWPVKIIESHLIQILLNLSINARDAIRDKGSVSLKIDNITDPIYPRAYRYDDKLNDHVIITGNSIPDNLTDSIKLHGEYVDITVIDNGMGMNHETQERIFDPLYTTKSKNHGTGLGLQVVARTVKVNNGFIILDSELGIGSRFDILLPKGDRTETLTETELSLDNNSKLNCQQREDSCFKKCKVLVIDDDPMLLKVISEMLETLDCHPIVTTSPAEVVKCIKKYNHIDILLADVYMTEVDSIKLVRQVQKIKPDTKILYMSGCTYSLLGKIPEITPSNFLYKPFTRDILEEKISELFQ